MPNKEEGQAEFERETGINLEHDIDHVVAFLVPTERQPRYTGMVLASGRFDAVRLEGLAREHGGEVEQYKGKRLVKRVSLNATRTRTKEYIPILKSTRVTTARYRVVVTSKGAPVLIDGLAVSRK
jgi:hypothetical protein